MNAKTYKGCAVPLCGNTSINSPSKLFIHVPSKKTMRHKWLKLARRKLISDNKKTSYYFCEDHFDLPNDMENYMQYHVMGSVSRICMKPGCVPTKFECQPDRTQHTSDTEEETITTETSSEFSDTEEFLFPSNSLVQPEHNEKDTEVNLYPACNICKEDIIGFRYVCVECSNWDMCGDCEADGGHSHHYLLRLPKRNVEQRNLLDLIETINQKLASLQELTEIKDEPYDMNGQEHTLHDDVDIETFIPKAMEGIKNYPLKKLQDLSPDKYAKSLDSPATVPTSTVQSTNLLVPLERNNILLHPETGFFHTASPIRERRLKLIKVEKKFILNNNLLIHQPFKIFPLLGPKPSPSKSD